MFALKRFSDERSILANEGMDYLPYPCHGRGGIDTLTLPAVSRRDQPFRRKLPVLNGYRVIENSPGCCPIVNSTPDCAGSGGLPFCHQRMKRSQGGKRPIRISAFNRPGQPPR